jgi:hypothetical protein
MRHDGTLHLHIQITKAKIEEDHCELIHDSKSEMTGR